MKTSERQTAVTAQRTGVRPLGLLEREAPRKGWRDGIVRRGWPVAAWLTLLLMLPGPSALAEAGMAAEEQWLRTLVTATPQEGFMLAVKLARKGVATTQPDKAVLKSLRGAYAEKPEDLIMASEVIAIHFQTIAMANKYWREQ